MPARECDDVMQPEILFLILNYGVLLPWALLVLAPRWSVTRALVTGGGPIIALAIVYGLVMLLAPMSPGGGDLPSVARVLGSPWGATAVWIHALAFDLFVGAWVVRDAERRAIRHRWVAPCLVLILFAGPAGLMSYLVLRLVTGHGAGLPEHPAALPSPR